MRVRAWHAEAILRGHEGGTAARRARRCGRVCGLFERHRAALGATELRRGGTSPRRPASSASFGLRVALERGGPGAGAIAWAERGGAQAACGWASGAAARRATSSPPSSKSSGAWPPSASTPRCATRTTRALRSRTSGGWSARSSTTPGMPVPAGRAAAPTARLAPALGERGARGVRRAAAARCTPSRSPEGGRGCKDSAPSRTPSAELERLRFALRRERERPRHRARPCGGSASRRRRARDALAPRAARGRRPAAGDRADGRAARASLGALPALRGRPVTVAPSAACGCSAGRRHRGASAARVLAVAGPGLAAPSGR